MDLPLQIGLAIYYLAKLRMLDSYYNFIDKYIDRSVFSLMEIDTGSSYFAFSEDSNEKLIKPQMRDEYEKKKKRFTIRKELHPIFKFMEQDLHMLNMINQAWFIQRRRNRDNS
jgi:hypothetical protein